MLGGEGGLVGVGFLLAFGELVDCCVNAIVNVVTVIG